MNTKDDISGTPASTDYLEEEAISPSTVSEAEALAPVVDAPVKALEESPEVQGKIADTKHIAVVTMGVKLGDEARGYTRFKFLSELLVSLGYQVDLITSSFQHWEKAQRDCSKECYQNQPYRIVFIDEPGYEKNLDLARIRSHAQAAKNLKAHFNSKGGCYDLVYAEIPPNDVARVCAEFARDRHIPFVADINDLWPEAMRMVVDVPVVSDIVFHPFARDAKIVYKLLTAAVGTSDEYAARPATDRRAPYFRETVYVGNNLAAFDAGVEKYRDEVQKPPGELWVTYAGTLGASYDLKTLIEAGVQIAKQARYQPSLSAIRVKILGDGPDRQELEALAASLDAPVDFLGYMDYEHMAAYLAVSNIVVNSLVKSAAQSIVTKIGDYLASGKAMINTGSSREFRMKVARDGFGVNVEAEDPKALADAIAELATHSSERKAMGAKARQVAEREFDQAQSYRVITDLIASLLNDQAP